MYVQYLKIVKCNVFYLCICSLIIICKQIFCCFFHLLITIDGCNNYIEDVYFVYFQNITKERRKVLMRAHVNELYC